MKPNGCQRRKFAQFCGFTRYVYNRGLAWNNESYEKDKSFKGSSEQMPFSAAFARIE